MVSYIKQNSKIKMIIIKLITFVLPITILIFGISKLKSKIK